MEFDNQAITEAFETAFNQNEPAESSPSQVEPGTTSTSEASFTNIDPNKLDPQLQEVYKSLQADYTRKMQAAAPYRKIGEEFGFDPDSMREAAQFVSALRDPSNLVSFHQELSEYLQSQGLTKAQADQVATQAQQEDNSTLESWEVDPQTEALRKELDELKNWKNSFEEQQQLSNIESVLARQEAQIRHDNPNYGDDDINEIYLLSYAFGGDLGNAQSAYEAIRSRTIESYINDKSGVPSPPPGSTGYAQVPETFKTLDEAHKYALKYAAAQLNQ
jgi:hypothetical protein